VLKRDVKLQLTNCHATVVGRSFTHIQPMALLTLPSWEDNRGRKQRQSAAGVRLTSTVTVRLVNKRSAPVLQSLRDYGEHLLYLHGGNIKLQWDKVQQVNLAICKAPTAFSKALRYSNTQLYLQTSHTCLYSPATEHHHPLAGTHFTIPQRVEG